jgi:hypothetical protein
LEQVFRNALRLTKRNKVKAVDENDSPKARFAMEAKKRFRGPAGFFGSKVSLEEMIEILFTGKRRIAVLLISCQALTACGVAYEII